jgi:hypothetical protein
MLITLLNSRAGQFQFVTCSVEAVVPKRPETQHTRSHAGYWQKSYLFSGIQMISFLQYLHGSWVYRKVYPLFVR